MSPLSTSEDNSFYESANPDRHFVRPIAPEAARSKRNHLKPGSEKLRFSALTARFRIDGSHAQNLAAITPCHSLITRNQSNNNLDANNVQDHRLCSLRILVDNDSDEDNRTTIVGTVHVPASIAQTLVPGRYQLIALSVTRLFSDPSTYESLHPDLQDGLRDLPAPSDANKKPEPIASDEEHTKRTPDVDDYHEQDNDEDEEVELMISELDQLEFDTTKFDIAVPWCIYNVMLVQKTANHETSSGDRGGSGCEDVYHRLGIGKINVDAFLDAKPVWEEVWLG